jgi:CheY-like chemotaxis protein
VGSSKSFGPEVLERIVESGTGVVLIDITEGTHDPVGLRTIRTVRQRFGSAIGIIALTAFSEYRDAALACGADRYVKKGVSNDDLRAAIRTCKHHETISKLELFLDEREVQVTVTRSGASERKGQVNLGRQAFALVYYLAEERARGQMGWIGKEDRDEKAKPYEFREMAFWNAIRTRWIRPEPDEKPGGEDIATRYASMINREIKNSLQTESLPLVSVPGGGRKGSHSYTSTYFLNPYIESTQVHFRGTRVRFPGE